MTLKEIEICQQFEQSDRSGQALWWPIVAPGNPAPDCLALLEGNGRYAFTFLHDRWSVRDGEWCHHAEDGAVTPMGNVREEAWDAAMSIKDRLAEDRDFGCYVIPVIVLTDMTPDPDILEEMRGSKVRLLWSLDDLVARLADLPEGDQVQKQLGKRLIAQEVEKLSRRPAAAEPAPPPKAATLTVSDGSVTVRDGDDAPHRCPPPLHHHCTRRWRQPVAERSGSVAPGTSGRRSPRRADVCGLTAFPHGTGVGMEPASGQAIARGHSLRAVPICGDCPAPFRNCR